MKQSFTEEDILRFLYNEMSIRESESFLDALYSDENLWQKFEGYQHVVDKLVPLDLEPSENTLNSILSFVEETQPSFDGKEAASAFPTLTNPRRPHQLVLMAVVICITSLVISGSLYFVSQKGISEDQQALTQKLIEEELSSEHKWEDTELEQQIEDIKKLIHELKSPEDSTSEKKE